MAKCKTCGAPVNLAPDGDPRYEKPISKPDFGYVEVGCSDLEALKAKADKADDLENALWLIQRMYYMEGKEPEWRAAHMNGCARDAAEGNDFTWAKRYFPRGMAAEAFAMSQQPEQR